MYERKQHKQQTTNNIQQTSYVEAKKDALKCLQP